MMTGFSNSIIIILSSSSGRKEKVLDCDKKGVIAKRLDISKIEGAYANWECATDGDLCYDTDGLELEFEQRDNGHLIIDTPKMVCGAV